MGTGMDAPCLPYKAIPLKPTIKAYLPRPTPCLINIIPIFVLDWFTHVTNWSAFLKDILILGT